jgi:hypothetical protein
MDLVEINYIGGEAAETVFNFALDRRRVRASGEVITGT